VTNVFPIGKTSSRVRPQKTAGIIVIL